MGKKILKLYASKSKPGKVYSIIEPDGGGEPYCDCWQWKRNRTCSHLKAYHASVGSAQSEVLVEVKQPSGNTDIFQDAIAGMFS